MKNLYYCLLFALSVVAVNVQAQNITAVSPSSANTGEYLEIVISGVNTHFESASNTNVYFTQGTTTVYPYYYDTYAYSDTYLETYVYFSSASPTGYYDVHVSDNIDGSMTLNNAITVLPPAPQIESVSPSSAHQGDVLSVAISGYYFEQASSTSSTSVWLQQNSDSLTSNYKIAASSVAVTNDEQVKATFTVPQGASLGNYDIYVNNSLSGETSLTDGFYITPKTTAKQITAVTPSSAHVGDYLEVSISGVNTHFKSASTTSVYFTQGTTTIYPYYVYSLNDSFLETSIDFWSASSTGSYDVHISNNVDGVITLTNGFTLIPPAPQIYSVSPSSAHQGDVLSVAISGYNFEQASSTSSTSVWLQQNADSLHSASKLSASSVTITNDEQVNATFTVPSGASLGNYDVYVNNSISGEATLQDGFYITPNTTAKQITAVSPSSAQVGDELEVSISGVNTHFKSASTTSVYFTQGTTTIYPYYVYSLNDSYLETYIDFWSASSTGSYDVHVSDNVDGVVTLTNGFTVSPRIPIIKTVTPNTANQGDDLTVTISGANTYFEQGTGTISVWLEQGNAIINPTNISITNNLQVEATFVIKQNATLGNYDVYVNDAVDGSLSLANGFSVSPYNSADDVPKITVISPSSAYQTSGILEVSISGENTHFESASNTSVYFTQGTTTIYAMSTTIQDDTYLNAYFNFGYDQIPLGVFDVNVSNSVDNVITLVDGFTCNKLVPNETPITTKATTDIVAYPNPSKGTFMVDIGDFASSNITLQMVNTLGQKVFEKKYSAGGGSLLTIDATQLASGIYLLQIKTDKDVVTKQILISR